MMIATYSGQGKGSAHDAAFLVETADGVYLRVGSRIRPPSIRFLVLTNRGEAPANKAVVALALFLAHPSIVQSGCAVLYLILAWSAKTGLAGEGTLSMICSCCDNDPLRWKRCSVRTRAFSKTHTLPGVWFYRNSGRSL